MICLSSAFVLATDLERPRFDRVTNAQGLSQVSVSAIVEDHLGYLWLGTQDGLNRWDGYEMQVFKHDPSDPDSLSDNLIIGLYLDSRGDVWVVSQRPGLINRYDQGRQRFDRIEREGGAAGAPAGAVANAQAFVEDGRGHLWIGSFGGGLDIVDLDSLEVTTRVNDPEDPASLCGDRISAMRRDSRGRIWIATIGGGLCLSDGSQPWRFQSLLAGTDEDSLQDNRLASLAIDSRGDVWVGSVLGLAVVDGQSLRVKRVRQDLVTQSQQSFVLFSQRSMVIAEEGRGALWALTSRGLLKLDRANFETETFALPPPPISTMLVDAGGSVWVGSQGGGVARLLPGESSMRSYPNDRADPTSLSGNFVATLEQSASGTVWIGTNGGGASAYMPMKHRFHLARRTIDDGALTDDMVYGLEIDADGDLWVATMEGGLHHLDSSRSQLIQRYHLAPRLDHDLGSNFVRSVIQQPDGTILAGTVGGGLAEIDKTTHKVVRRHLPTGAVGGISSNVIQNLAIDAKQRVWVSTQNGWCSFNGGSFDCHLNDPADPSSLSNNFVRVTHEDRSGNLWVGSLGGLCRWDDPGFTCHRNRLDDPSSLSHDNVMDIWDDPEGLLWVATYGGGLSILDPDSGKVERLSEADGLPSDAIYSVLEAPDGGLWLSSNHGLARLDRQSRAVTTYELADGLPSNEFNGRAFLRSGDEMLFGGVGGWVSFDPLRIPPAPAPPRAVLTDFRKLDREVSFGKALWAVPKITVGWRDRLIAFEYVGIDHSAADRIRYGYRLEGFDQDWIDAGDRRYASYTSLPAGNYRFEARAAGASGEWGEPAAIDLVVTPPPWATWWAWCLYVLAAIGTVAGAVARAGRKHALELASEREETERQKLLVDRLQAIDRIKDEFLANTSHELRTPLNGIIGIAESLIDGAAGPLEPKAKLNLAMVASSGRRLAHLVDDILDFSKLKSHEINLARRSVGMRSLVEVVLIMLTPLLRDRSLELVCEIPEDFPAVDGDENRLQQILNNLIGNALKFTESGSVRVLGKNLPGEMVEIAVVDTGIGIPAERLEAIFESFEQADASAARSFGGTGLGLTISRQLVSLHGGELRVESTPGEGSCFAFTLPIWKGEAAAELERQPTELARIRDLESLEASATATSSGPSSSAKGGARILVVDDEVINLQVYDNMLGLAGFEVERAIDGPKALQAVARRRPDLILLDVMMPGMTGYEVAEKLRLEHPANRLPIILVTARNQVGDLVEGLGSGANDYLTKPFSKAELLARIRTHLSLSRAHTVEAENRRKTHELKQARAIQLSLLPDAPPRLPGFEIAVYLETATEVGGDYYDFFSQPDGSLYLVTGDATGHGIPAGMMVSMTKSALKALDVQSPHILLGELSGVLRAVQVDRMMMALNVVHFNRGELAISSAAMPPVLIHRAATGEIDELLIPGVPLGAFEHPEYRLLVDRMQPGDLMVMLSDGLTERDNPDGEQLGDDAIFESIQANAERPVDDIVKALVELARQWGGDTPQGDDITILVARWGKKL